MPDENEALIERIRQGDENAMAEFIQKTRPQLAAFISRKLGATLQRKVEPDDIIQEVSQAACKSLSDMELGDRDPFSWLCQIAERRIMDAGRHFNAQKRDANRETPASAAGGDSGGDIFDFIRASFTTPSQAFSRNAREEKLAQALAELSPTQQEVLRLRYVENLPSKEIAEKVGKSDASVRVMLTRSLKKLEQILGEEPHG